MFGHSLALAQTLPDHAYDCGNILEGTIMGIVADRFQLG